MSQQPVPAVLARIRERDEQRQAALQTREGAGVLSEDIRSRCATLDLQVRAALGEAESILKEPRTLDLEAAAAALSSYKKAVAGASSHVPTYEAQQLHAHIKDFEEQLLQLRAQSAPKKRFSFARKPAPAPSQKGEARKNERHEPGSQAPAQGQGSCKPERSQSGRDTSVEGASKAQQHVRTSLASACGSDSSRQVSGSKDGEHSSTPAALSAAPLPANSNRCISGRMHETIEHVLGADGGPMVIRDLTSCTVCIRGRMEALRMHGLKDCTVIAGPVHGSAFVEGVEGSVLIIECNQARIHQSTDTTFLLRVKSNPIIEHCSRLRFGPIPIEAPKQDNGMWQQVQDFGWLRSTPSPNWGVTDDASTLRPELEAILVHWQQQA